MKRFKKEFAGIVFYLLPMLATIIFIFVSSLYFSRLKDQQLKMWDAIINNTKFDGKLIESDDRIIEIIKLLHPEISTNHIDEATLELQENKSQIQNHFND